MKLYIHQFLSRTGLFSSKKEVYAAIRAGEVSVAGKKITQPNYQFSSGKEVAWNGDVLKRVSECLYFVVNKPEGFLSSRLTAHDVKLKKRSVFSLIRDIDAKSEKTLFCVGRLDEDTSGLLILTNDGKFSTVLTNPEHEVQKTYRALLDAPLPKEAAGEIRKGIIIVLEENGKNAEYKTRPSTLSVDQNHATVTLTEGKKREVRRMFSAVGRTVLLLERSAIGNLALEDLHLPKGGCKAVTKEFLEKSIFS